MGGGDKCLLSLEGKSLLCHAISRLGPQVAGLVLNANGDPARFADYGLPVVADSVEGFAGPLAGVLAGLDYAAAHGFDRIVTAAADTPFLPADLVDHLLKAAQEADTPMAMAATPDPERGLSRHPTFALWPVSLRDDLRQALGDGVRKVIAWTDRHGCTSVAFGTDPIDPFFNVNTPDDLARAKQMLQELAT
jgi:molybdopterin-guanine dinucleotide biosynthesis protein A